MKQSLSKRSQKANYLKSVYFFANISYKSNKLFVCMESFWYIYIFVECIETD